MRIAGLGFQSAADICSLREALDAAGGTTDVIALATLDTKVSAAALRALAAELALPIYGVTPASIAGVATLTQSRTVIARFGVGSLAEAAALVVAGPSARLLGPRCLSRNGMATAAIAVRVNL